ncbi:MAG: DUF501 domain-containing protein [Coriobacteriia bacterium]
MDPDERSVTRQIGRSPRQPWRVSVRCAHGFPQVITTPSRLASGEPFPTLHYLTCPDLVEAVSALESDGQIEAWAHLLATVPEYATSMRLADAAYRAARTIESGGTDACEGVGIAGQRDPLGTKCLHAHVAAALAGINDPIGLTVLDIIGSECDNARCAEGDPDL